jgi:hypothetical protein
LRRKWAIDKADRPVVTAVADHDLKATVLLEIVRPVKAKGSVLSDHRLKNRHH